MLASVPGNLTLGYQMVWDSQRRPAGVLLFAQALDGVAIDGARLLAAVAQVWSEHAPRLILLPQSASLLADVLRHAPPDGPWIGVEESLCNDPAVVAQLGHAFTRGLRLVWRGAAIPPAESGIGAFFLQRVLPLGAGHALLALRAALHPTATDAGPRPDAAPSPVLGGQIYESVPSRILADHCLDQQGAWGIAGWPGEDILHAYAGQAILPSREVIQRLVHATDADLALDRIENILAEDPLLVYRFLRHANSAALGLRTGIDSLRHGLMVLGLTTFRRWLLEQLPSASGDINLRPVRTAMLLRARLMAALLDAGEDDALCSEVHLCGLLSQIDLVLGEPAATALQRFPVAERITSAILGHSGPYAPFLDIAAALEYPGMGSIAALCESHQIDRGHVNQALLWVLAQVRPQPLPPRSSG